MAHTVFPHEAHIISRYLVGREPGALVEKLYAKAITQELASSSSQQELKAVQLALAHPALLPLLDGGLALVRPQAELRRRVYTMFAILETMPEHSDKYLARDRSPFYLLAVGLIGIRAVLRALVGVIIIKALRA